MLAASALLVSAAWSGGCGYSQGQLLWAMGFGRSIQVDPEFELTKEGAVLVLVDDPEERLFSPGTRLELAEKLGRDLKGHKAIGRPVPQEKLARLETGQSAARRARRQAPAQRGTLHKTASGPRMRW